MKKNKIQSPKKEGNITGKKKRLIIAIKPVTTEEIKVIRKAHIKIALAVLGGVIYVDIANIVRCHSDNTYTTFYFFDGTSMLISKPIHEFETLLSEHDFFRVHKLHLINLRCIKQYHRGKGGYVILSDNSEVEVSARKRAKLLLLMEKI